MEMTTPVVTRKVQSVGEKMEMTTPVITRKVHISSVDHGVSLFFESSSDIVDRSIVGVALSVLVYSFFLLTIESSTFFMIYLSARSWR